MFNFIKRLFQPSITSQQEKEPDLDPKLLLADLQPKIEKAGTDCIKITTRVSTNIDLKKSKFGGLPYFPQDASYPIDEKGNPMELLVQINFAEVPRLESFPDKGLLQIYIAQDDDVYGMDFDDQLLQKNWRILYFENPDFTPRTDLAKLFTKEWEYSPLLTKEMELSFNLAKDYPNYPSLEYYNSIEPLLKSVADGDYEDFLSDLYVDQYLQDVNHKIGGTPYFTQNEVREFEPEYADYQLLLQIDSEGDKIMWGDVGVANFFIKKEDLERRDFSKVIYNWDCC